MYLSIQWRVVEIVVGKGVFVPDAVRERVCVTEAESGAPERDGDRVRDAVGVDVAVLVEDSDVDGDGLALSDPDDDGDTDAVRDDEDDRERLVEGVREGDAEAGSVAVDVGSSP